MAVLDLTPELLERALLFNGFAAPKEGLIFFGIRGAVPDMPANTDFAQKRSVTLASIDHLAMRCTLGQWNRAEGRIAIFPGSTVPSIGSIAVAKENGGAGANMLLPGRYAFVKGMHKDGKPSGHRAFRQAMFFPVRRTGNDTAYDNFDRIDFGSDASAFVADNLHAAYHAWPDQRFSSAGCQVVSGLPSSPSRGGAPETGAWHSFIANAYGLDQQRFAYLLFPASELAMLAAGEAGSIRQVVRFGSSGPAAKLVQAALVASGDLGSAPDGEFGRNSLMALAAFQKRVLGPGAVDGVCGAATAAALRIDMPTIAQGKPIAAKAADPAEIAGEDTPDETDFHGTEIRRLLARLGLDRFAPAVGGTPGPAGLARAPFFEACRQSLFGGSLGDAQLRGMGDVLDCWEKTFPEGDPRWLAYILASIFHETGRRMVPVREGFASSDESARNIVRRMFEQGRIRRDYAAPVNGVSYFGRGRVQVTHLANYEKCKRRFGRDFVNDPSLLLDSRIDAEVTVIGHVEGIWTGQKLADFIRADRCDYLGARRIVNGQDKAELIASYARAFEHALDAARRAVTVSPIPMPPVNPPIQQGVTLMSAEADAINARLDRLEALLVGLAPQPPADTPSPADPALNAERLKDIGQLVDKLVKAAPELAPVNNALGSGIGSLLNGRKSAIGIIGAIGSVLFSQAGSDSILTKLASVIVPAGSALSGISGPLLPVFLGLAAWGALGKLEKSNLAQIVAKQ